MRPLIEIDGQLGPGGLKSRSQGVQGMSAAVHSLRTNSGPVGRNRREGLAAGVDGGPRGGAQPVPAASRVRVSAAADSLGVPRRSGVGGTQVYVSALYVGWCGPDRGKTLQPMIRADTTRSPSARVIDAGDDHAT